MNRKIVISKINAIGAMRQAADFSKSDDRTSGRELRKLYCSDDNDSITTYVQKKIWVVQNNNFLFPPYVECEYVV